MSVRMSSLVVWPSLILTASSIAGCSIEALAGPDTSNTSCDVGSAASDANVDVSVRLLLQVSGEFKDTAANTRATVLAACANIAKDLGGGDSWSKHGDSNDAIANGDNTGACNVAALRIQGIMDASANANFALVVTKGACYPDFAAQTKCDAQCNAEAKCDSGTTETRCEPAALSCTCSSVCKVSGSCRGTVSLEANCTGKCEGTCNGECKGTCTSASGTKTDNDKNCRGKCSASCSGKCTGDCKIEVEGGLNCGANVRCRGECEGAYTEPKCETSFTPPKCVVDASCIAACSSSVSAKAVCDPPSVELLCNTSVNADVAKLAATVRANFPVVLAAAQTQGKLVLDAALRLKAAGEAVVKSSSKLNAHSIACAVGGAKVAGDATAKLSVAVQGGALVTETCTARAQ
ncbi:MAG: hypothetical protein IPG50_37275 [Myxococcales bacterium]|nr:hypothetical protein [Myxococcales bacterium]